MSAEHFSELLESCDGSSSQFRTLIDGCLDRRSSSEGFEEVAQILCDSREAEQLLEFAIGVSAEAAEEIQVCLSCFREL
jgi:hypothetical protein